MPQNYQFFPLGRIFPAPLKRLLKSLIKSNAEKMTLIKPQPACSGIKHFPCLSAWKQLRERWIKHAMEQHRSAGRTLGRLWPPSDSLTLLLVEVQNNDRLSSYTQICFLLSYFKEICSVWRRQLAKAAAKQSWLETGWLISVNAHPLRVWVTHAKLKWSSC